MLWKSVTLICCFFITNAIFANSCNDLNCVRKNIDDIDSKIVTLIGKRLSQVRRAGELKTQRVSVHDQARENKILNTVAIQAENEGYSGAM